MNQQTLQFMKQTQIAETCKKNAETYFCVKQKPQTPANRPPECQQIDFFYSTPFLNKQGMKSKISSIYNTTKMSAEKNSPTKQSQCLKLAANMADPKEIQDYVNDILKFYPNSLFPILVSVLNNNNHQLLCHLSQLQVEKNEIAPFFALADEVNLFNDDMKDMPLLNLILKNRKQFYVDHPQFIAYSKIEPGMLSKEVKRRYNYFDSKAFQSCFSKEMPNLTKVQVETDSTE